MGKESRFNVTPETAMRYAREDIADMGAATTRSSCERLHVAISGYCRALLDCGLINSAQKKQLMNEADDALASWKMPIVLPADWIG
jgi:hypothetical protein